MCSMNTRQSIFFSQTSVRIQLNDTKGVKSQSENRKLGEETLVSRKVYLFHTDFSPCSTLQVTWIQTHLKLLRLPLFGGQPCRLTNSFVEYYRFDSLMSQLFRSLEYNTCLKLLQLPLSAVNLVDLLIHSSNIIDSTHSCRNSSNHLNTTRISSY